LVRRLHSDFVTASRIEEYSSILRHAREAGYALISLDVFLADDAAVKIAPQIDERFLAAADRFAINPLVVQGTVLRTRALPPDVATAWPIAPSRPVVAPIHAAPAASFVATTPGPFAANLANSAPDD
jgi:hypothetical protein